MIDVMACHGSAAGALNEKTCGWCRAHRTDYIPHVDNAINRQLERFRAMTADEKVRLSHALWIETRSLTAAGVRGAHPDWSDEQISARVRELMRDAGA